MLCHYNFCHNKKIILQHDAPEAKRVSTDSESENDDDNDAPEPVTGAMDGFLNNSAASKAQTKKTKKKLVEKTFMDPKGYFGEYDGKRKFSRLNTAITQGIILFFSCDSHRECMGRRHR